METLRHDLKNIQGGLKELLSRVGPLEVPSWCFPERIASSVNAEEVLKSVNLSSGDNNSKVVLLELVVDRLLLLLQCCMRLSEQSFGHRSASLPLTLGSTVKKFSKRVLQDSSVAKDLNNEISSKAKTISSLESALHQLQEENRLLQETQLKLSPNKLPRSELPENVSGTNTEPTVSRPSTSNSSLVPYEAIGTLKINSLSSITANKSWQSTGIDNGRSSMVQNPFGSAPAETSQQRTMSSLTSRQMNIVSLTQPKSTHISTQTTETAFALCAKCSDTHTVLVNVADSVASIFSKYDQSSNMALTDWSAMAEVGGLEVERWRKSFNSDLNGLDEFCHKQQERITRLVSERDLLQETIGKVESESQLLGTQIESLQVSIEEIKQTNECSAAKNSQVFTDKLKHLEEINSNLEARYEKTRDDLNTVQRHEANLKSLAAKLEHRHVQLQNDLQVALHHEIQLVSTKESLEKEVSCKKIELESYREQLDSNKLELSKTRVCNQTLEKRNKSLKTKQLSLLSRLDELDQGCTSLGEELRDVKGSRDQLSGEVERIKRECEILKGQLEEEQSKLLESNREQDNLMQVLSGLEGELEGVRKQLEEEKHNCRLLMDYPFVKQTSEDYRSYVSSLASSAGSSQKQISANTIRILLLEEQNSDLRQNIIKLAKETKRSSKNGRSFQLKLPVQTWRSGFLSELKEEQMLAREASIVDYSHSDDRVHPHAGVQPGTRGRHLPSSAATHKRKVQSATETSRLSQTNMNSGVSRSSQNYEWSPTKSSRTKHNPTSLRPSSSSAKLKGRLGDLVAAIAEAHRTSTTSLSTTVLTEDGTHVHKGLPPIDGHVQQVWTDGTLSSTCSSLELGQVHICEQCDRMYHDKAELEKHQILCQL